MEAARDSHAEQLASGANRPAPVAVTSIDPAGRPQIRQLSGADLFETAETAVDTVEASLNSGESVLAVEIDRMASADGEAIVDDEAMREALASEAPASTPTLPLPNVVVGATGTGSDPGRIGQWALDQFPFEDAAMAVSGEENVLISIVDTGIRLNHPDLAGAVMTSRNFTDEPLGCTGNHGTHVAGIIAARPGNRIGVVGAAPRVRLLNAKVLDSKGIGYMSDVALAITWSVDSGAQVVNLSLSGEEENSSVSAALTYAEAKGVVVVAAAGNEGLKGSPFAWPAADDRTLAVAALTEEGNIAAFSTKAPYVDLAAPGQLIQSTSADPEYMYMNGTSMATPFVSALVALTIAAGPKSTPAQIRARLTSEAIDIAEAGRDDSSGWGMINLNSLLPPI